MSVGDKRQRVTQQEAVGKHTRGQEQFPTAREEKNPVMRGRTTHFTQQTSPTPQQIYTRNTRAHTHRRAQNMHTRAGTKVHTGLPVVDTRASVLPSESLSLPPWVAGQCPARLGVGRGSATYLEASAAAGWGRSAGPEAAAM